MRPLGLGGDGERRDVVVRGDRARVERALYLLVQLRGRRCGAGEQREVFGQCRGGEVAVIERPLFQPLPLGPNHPADRCALKHRPGPLLGKPELTGERPAGAQCQERVAECAVGEQLGRRGFGGEESTIVSPSALSTGVAAPGSAPPLRIVSVPAATAGSEPMTGAWT